MAYEFEGRTIATTASGYLEDHSEWSEALAAHIAALESIELTPRHWDVMNYLREEYFDNGETQPNTRTIIAERSLPSRAVRRCSGASQRPIIRRLLKHPQRTGQLSNHSVRF